MSGGDIGPLGPDAVNQLHNLFRWANRSRRGLLLFIDEAEAFLSSRSQTQFAASGADESHLRHALNALLYQTGTQSKSFMLVLATNRPEDLDVAILDRIDVSLRIDLPEHQERTALVKMYMDIHVTRAASSSPRKSLLSNERVLSVSAECYDEMYLDGIARQMMGFSGREISKVFVAAQYTMRMAADGRLSRHLLDQTISFKLEEHQQKLGFQVYRGNDNPETNPVETREVKKVGKRGSRKSTNN